jgi:glucan 1,3-beta-glucosidase
MNFYDMFDLNQDDSLDSEESGPIQGDIWNAIVQISEEAMVDARFILAIIMQEVQVLPRGLWCRFADVGIAT